MRERERAPEKESYEEMTKAQDKTQINYYSIFTKNILAHSQYLP